PRQHTHVAGAGGVVALVDDDQVERVLGADPGELTLPALVAQGVDHAGEDRAAGAVGALTLHAADQDGLVVHPAALGDLVEQLAAVGQDEHPAALARGVHGGLGQHVGLAAAGRQHHAGAVAPGRPLRVDGLDGGLLVVTQHAGHALSPFASWLAAALAPARPG